MLENRNDWLCIKLTPKGHIEIRNIKTNETKVVNFDYCKKHFIKWYLDLWEAYVQFREEMVNRRIWVNIEELRMMKDIDYKFEENYQQKKYKFSPFIFVLLVSALIKHDIPHNKSDYIWKCNFDNWQERYSVQAIKQSELNQMKDYFTEAQKTWLLEKKLIF